MKKRWFPTGHTPSNGKKIKSIKRSKNLNHKGQNSSCKSFKKEFTISVESMDIIGKDEKMILWNELVSEILSNPNKPWKELIKIKTRIS